MLLLGSFVAHGAEVVHPVRAAEALREFRDLPAYAGDAGWHRPLGGMRPAAGVYVYRTSGRAVVDRPGVERRYPAETLRVVRHGPGCQWREHVLVFREHRETYSACAAAGDQLDTGFGTRLVYFLVPSVTDVVCDVPGTRTGAGLPPGGRRDLRCRDRRSRTAVTGHAVRGPERTVQVGGRAVRCREVTVTTVFHGESTGAAVRVLCTDPRTGLVVHEQRSVGVVARSAFVGRVSYRERAEFTLRSLAPLR